jgi:hypothetical protein
MVRFTLAHPDLMWAVYEFYTTKKKKKEEVGNLVGDQEGGSQCFLENL